MLKKRARSSGAKALSVGLLCASGALALSGCLVQKPGQGGPAAGGATGAISHNLIGNATFTGGKSVPWSGSFTEPGKGDVAVENDALCIKIENKGANNWDAQLRVRDMVIERGRDYTLRFKMWASAPTQARPKVGMSGPPYAEYWAETISLGTDPKSFGGQFTMKLKDDPMAELAIHLGGSLAGAEPLTVCIDDVYLENPEFVREETKSDDAAMPKLLTNQVGYLPKRAKIAALVNESTTPVKWQLLSKGGDTVAEGETLVHGQDAASGKHVHVIDFSSHTGEGEGFVLTAGGERSHPFDIGASVYKKLKYDALAYFYHNRSGIDISMPYAGGDQWTRPAGHMHDNQVGCAPKAGCNHTLDVSGGWYDAGDHGKYVVNGGIAVWTMLNQYERVATVGKSKADFEDGKMQIPEQKNGVADLLDEARWQLEFMLKMQIPTGDLAGMVHHKIHDAAWTALPLPPHKDKQKRQLYAPSTAATLNVAATAAQGARIWKTIDPKFAQKCLNAAQRAWTAAQKNPAMYYKPGDVGGGPYDDSKVDDEFFWAASELLISTGSPIYRDFVVKSPFHGKLNTASTEMGGVTPMTWQNTEALGTISLAIAAGAPKEEQALAREAIKQAADLFLQTIQKEGFRLPFGPASDGTFPWGSNSSVLNNMIVLALAYDFTSDTRYVDGVVLGMDYLLGRNPLDQSYVSGYGERPLKNPHHRFWAQQLDKNFPPPPPGAVSGGPNSSLQDPYAKGMGLKGCAPQTCFVDHIESYSTNEITINWNAPFAWVSAFLDEAGQRGI